MHRIVCAILVTLLFVSPAKALSGRGTTAATFLKIGVGPRAVAMGEAAAAAAECPAAIYWNPAGLASLQDIEVTAMHTFWLEDIYFDYVAAAFPVGPGVAGVSLVYLNHGWLERSDDGDTPEDPSRGLFSAADGGLTGAWAYAYSDTLKLGAALKVFTETVDAQASVGWALDLGFVYHTPWPGLRLGGEVANIGPAVALDEAYFRLPINFKLGLAYAPDPAVLLTLDYNQLLEQTGRLAVGVEYWFENLLALRAGYRYQSRIDDAELYEAFGTNALSGVSAGVGVRYGEFNLDYAFVPYGFLGTTHRIALTVRFSMPEKSRVASRP